MSENKILYERQKGACVLKLLGRLTHTLGDDFDVLIEEEILGGERLERILIDLSELESIDSTILGLLAKIARRRLDSSQKKPTLFAPNENISRILNSMGFPAVFDIVHMPLLVSTSCKPIPKAGEGARDMGQLMLDAHRLLQEMNEKNRDTFQTVVEILGKELQKKRNTSG